MGRSIALAARMYSAAPITRTYMQRRWWRSVLTASQQQQAEPHSGTICEFLERPCHAVSTADGELALEFGTPPLVVLSSDTVLLPKLRADVQRLRRMRVIPLSDTNRDRLAHIHRAALLLIDALEQLSHGLPGHHVSPPVLP